MAALKHKDGDIGDFDPLNNIVKHVSAAPKGSYRVILEGKFTKLGTTYTVKSTTVAVTIN